MYENLSTCKYSARMARHAGFLESILNRLHSILQSFAGFNAKGSLIPEQVTGKSLIIRMADLSSYELDIFTNVFLAWLMCFRDGER